MARRARHPRRHGEHQPRWHVRRGLQPPEQRGLPSLERGGGGGRDLGPERRGHRDAERDAGSGHAPAQRSAMDTQELLDADDAEGPERAGAPRRRFRCLDTRKLAPCRERTFAVAAVE